MSSLIKKVITEVLLVLPLYLILFFICLQFRHLIKIMADVGVILNDNEFFGDVVDTPKESIEHHKKQECLKGAIDKGKRHLLGKWTHERVDKASDEAFNKKYAEYIQRELSEKGKQVGKGLIKHVINLYSRGISCFVKIRDVKKLQQDIENDPVIQDQMAALDCLLVYTFRDYLVGILVVVHTVHNLDRGNVPKNEGDESEL